MLKQFALLRGTESFLRPARTRSPPLAHIGERTRYRGSLLFSTIRPQYHSPSILLPIFLLISGGDCGGIGSARRLFGSSTALGRHIRSGAGFHSTSFASAFALGPAPSTGRMFRRGRTLADPARSTSTATNGSKSDCEPSKGTELPTKWNDIIDLSSHLRKCVPPLTPSCHKGSSGRVGVLGGSARYTGAPYYAAMASLRTGADLAFVFCAEEAAIPIKSYSPELMVASVYKESEFDALISQEEKLRSSIKEEGVDGNSLTSAEGDGDSLAQVEAKQEEVIQKMVDSVVDTFDRLHVLIIGPGLGRNALVLRAAARIISEAKEKKLPMVIDADGLYLLTLEENAGLVAGYDRLILTPNAMEVKRLTQAMAASGDVVAKGEAGKDSKKEKSDGSSNGNAVLNKSPPGSPIRGTVQTAWADSPEHRISSDMTAFEQATESVVIVKKGAVDVIFSTTLEALHVNRRSMLCEEKGGLKRSGGIGDILSGCIGTFVAWNRILSTSDEAPPLATNGDREKLNLVNVNHDDLLLGVWSACAITKRATWRAFERKRRGMTAPDVLTELSSTVDEMTGSSIHVNDGEEI